MAPFVMMEAEAAPALGPGRIHAVELTLLWGGEVVATALSSREVVRASDHLGPIASCFEDLVLARRTPEGQVLVLPNGEAAPADTRLGLRSGKATLRVRLVAPVASEDDALVRTPIGPDTRVRRAFLGATILHVAIVLVGVLRTPGPEERAPDAVSLMGPSPLAAWTAKGAQGGDGSGEASFEETTPTSAPAEVAPVVAPVRAAVHEAEPSSFGMIALARKGPRARSRAAYAFAAFEPKPEALAMFTESIDEGPAGLALTEP